ncbi:hypothetical protein [Lentzea sp. HUAS12]|uniref:hypothetical protein n=1 Tax=Lentzea sp. HUAS12 TaxID=2951806 RepID=UPI0020A0EB28|nr:hypothetical protein [Lentzea sp. HUAS12]USX56451.1 hypothetical protein ND450_20820 [Lentzea sp. HUAS12]
MFVGELAQRGHQTWNLAAHDRQSRLGIAIRSDSLQQVEVVLESLTQFGEQDVVAHH